MAKIYENTDLIANAERQLEALIITETFKAFATKFTRLEYTTKYNERHLIRILRKKLLNRLLKPLATLSSKKDFTTLRELKTYLTKLDNIQRLNLQFFKATVSSKTSRTASKPTAYVISANRVKAADLIAATRPAKDIRVVTYYNCEKPNHLKSNYPDLDKEQTKAEKRATTARINEVKINEIKSNIDSDSSSSSGNV